MPTLCTAPPARPLPARAKRKAICRPPQAAGGTENPLVTALVGASTVVLRLAGVGEREYRAAAAPSTAGRPLARGDVGGLLRTLRRDFEGQYFVTGVLENDAIYDPQCLYADPTVSFRGRDAYKRNLGLVAAFLEDPIIQLRSLRRLPARSSSSDRGGGGGGGGGATQLRAEWVLTCWVRLPWAPCVRVGGSTAYTLNAAQNQIVSHVEAWDVSAAQALALLLRPSERAAWRRPPPQRA